MNERYRVINIERLTMSEYIRFIKKNRRALTFGWSLTFFSSFGQTFFISLFVPSILVAFELSKSAFGAYYAAATITASLILLNYGHTVDTKPIGRLTRMTTDRKSTRLNSSQ